jgi:tRNA(fMet)-specific endonuclease VapC
MGLILDSSVLVAAERKGQTARLALAQIALIASGEDIALWVVTLIELTHGAARANTPDRQPREDSF